VIEPTVETLRTWKEYVAAVKVLDLNQQTDDEFAKWKAAAAGYLEGQDRLEVWFAINKPSILASLRDTLAEQSEVAS